MASAVVARLPAWVTPNQVSAVGIACTIMCGVAFFLAGLNRAWLLLAIVGLVLNWVADNVDGTLARTRGMTSERGFFLDLFLDGLGTLAIALGLAFASYTVPILILLFEIVHLFTVVMIFSWILMRGIFPLGAVGPAEMRVILIALCLLTFFTQGSVLQVGGVGLGWFDLGAVVMIPLGTVQVALSAIRLYRTLEPVKR
jgi:phosphatidylglycerophosphate synthase